MIKYHYRKWWAEATREARASVAANADLVYNGFRLEPTVAWTPPNTPHKKTEPQWFADLAWIELTPEERSGIERVLYYKWRVRHKIPADEIEWPANVSGAHFLELTTS